MRKLLVTTFLTLDGVMQAPGGKDEDTEGGFQHGGWQLDNDYIDDVGGQAIVESFESSDGMLLGRRTYDIFAAFWPTSDEEPFAGLMNNMKKYVASRTLEEPLEWQNSELLQGDTVKAVRELKENPGRDLVVIGSGDFAQTLIDNDLVDEYRLMIHPIVVGGGKRLFRDGAETALRIVEAKPSASVLLVRLQPAPQASSR